MRGREHEKLTHTPHTYIEKEDYRHNRFEPPGLTESPPKVNGYFIGL